MIQNLKVVIILVIGLVTISHQQDYGDMPPPVIGMAGGWFNIEKYDRDLVGLSVRGINYINNNLGLKPGYRFIGISGQPQSQVVAGRNFKATVVIRLIGKPYVYCNFLMYRKPLFAPDYLDVTEYKVNCQDGQNFSFEVSLPWKSA